MLVINVSKQNVTIKLATQTIMTENCRDSGKCDFVISIKSFVYALFYRQVIFKIWCHNIGFLMHKLLLEGLFVCSFERDRFMHPQPTGTDQKKKTVKSV